MALYRTRHVSKYVEDYYGFFISWFWLSATPIIKYNRLSLYGIASILLMINAYVCVATIIIDIFAVPHDLQYMVENTRVAVPASNALWFHFIISFHKSEITELMAFQWEGFETTVLGPMTLLLPRIQPMTVKTNIVFFGIHSIYSFLRVILTKTRQLAVNSYWGFDVTPSPIYQLIFVAQYCMEWICFMLFFGFTGFYAYTVATACSHLETLREDLIRTKESSDIKKHLQKCIRHHQKILAYVGLVEKVSSPVLLGQFLLILGGMCLSAFSAAMSWRSPLHIAQAFLVYSSFVAQLFVYCWFGSELSDELQLVSEAAYNSDWVGIPLSEQRSIQFIIVAANKEVLLTAGKFVPATRKTMQNVINQTISFLMFLINVSNDDVQV
ncbi:Odorant receptor 103 [Blattella germanica]|nr:Odorant receptor 103 [Blattella germanica]